MFYHPIMSQLIAVEHRAELERKLRHLPPRSDLEARPGRRRLGRRHPND